MKDSKVLKAYLIVAGLLLAFIGGATLLMPVALKTGSGIDIAGNINVINDVRASSALLFSLAVVMLTGAFSPKLTYTASLLSAVLFLALGTGRVVSILADGMPVEGLIGATGLEFVLGIVGAILFIRFQEKK
ncbi:MAG: DUF4345 domain-containing protein [Bacteroidota bacterium]